MFDKFSHLEHSLNIVTYLYQEFLANFPGTSDEEQVFLLVPYSGNNFIALLVLPEALSLLNFQRGSLFFYEY